jgi:hypothetical protein
MATIHGAVERIDAQSVLGWARASAADTDLRVDVVLGEEVIGSGIRGVHRPDLGGDFGFRVQCHSAFSALDVISKRLRVVARIDDGIPSELPLVPTLRSQQMAQFAVGTMRDYSTAEIVRVLDAIGTLPALASQGAPPTAESVRAREHTAGLLKSLPPRLTGGAAAFEISHVPVPAGFVSTDGSAVLGTNGQSYLVGGSNLVLEQFMTPADHPSLASLGARWREALLRRARTLQGEGVGFLQTIIPEKLSVLPEDFPFEIPTPSPLLRAVETAVSSSPAVPNVVIWGRAHIVPRMAPGEVFGRLDTHLTVKAAYLLFTDLLERLGQACPFGLELDGTARVVGDLAERFFGTPLPEIYHVPSSAYDSRLSAAVEVLEKVIPETGHIGTRLVWRNRAAPIDLRVVAFANSFFERGGSARSLSWWFSRAVREFHFIWSPDLDLDYVRRVAPDWVICQTIERFLARTPQDTGLE